MNSLIHQSGLAFAYTQAGQENSFGWDAMKTGLTRRVELFAAQAKAGEIQVQTLDQAGNGLAGPAQRRQLLHRLLFVRLKDIRHRADGYARKRPVRLAL